MRLKTKLVLAITALVFFIAGLLSLVYVSQLLQEAVTQSYDTNKMVANQVQLRRKRNRMMHASTSPMKIASRTLAMDSRTISDWS